MPERKIISGSHKQGKCLSIDNIKGYLEGRLSPDARERVEQHIRFCPLCADAVEGYREFGFSRSLANVAEINQRIGGKQPRESQSPVLLPVFRIAAAFIGLLILVGAGWLIFRYAGNFSSEDASTAEKQQQPAAGIEKMIEDTGGVVAAIPDTVNLDTQESLLAYEPESKQVIPEMDVEIQKDRVSEKPVKEKVLEEKKPNVVEDEAESLLLVKKADKQLTYFDTALARNDVKIENHQASPTISNNAELSSVEIMSTSGKPQRNSRLKEETIFTPQTVDVPPKYPGGDAALQKYIRENLHYPDGEQSAGKAGTVIISFTINEKGKVKNEEVVKGLNDDFDKEALRVIKRMDNWEPGKKNGEDVEVKMSVPIKFTPPKE